MLQYLLNEQYRQAHNFMSSLGFLSSESNFKNCNFQKVRAIIRGEERDRDVAFWGKCCEVLCVKKNKPKEMAKMLIFIHLLLQTGNKKNEDILELANKQINKIVDKCKAYCQSKHPTTATLHPSISLTSVITDTEVSPSPSPTDQMKIKSQSDLASQSSYSSKISHTSSLASEISEISSTVQSDATSKHEYISEKEIICEKIIEPYASYLLKKCTVDFSTQQDNQTPQQLQIWHQINSLKSLFAITSNYYTVMRYYDHKYYNMILRLTCLLSNQIHRSYPRIVRLVQNKLRETVKQLQNRSSPKVNNQINKENITQNTTTPLNPQHDLTEIKQLLKEIGELNQSLIYFYMNKYISVQLRNIDVKIPDLMNLDSMDCQVIFYHLHEQDRRNEKDSKKGDIKKCREGLGRFAKRPAPISTDKQALSPLSPVNETMTPNRLPRANGLLLKKNSHNLPGQGYPGGSRGDVLAPIRVQVPSQIDELDEDRE